MMKEWQIMVDLLLLDDQCTLFWLLLLLLLLFSCYCFPHNEGLYVPLQWKSRRRDTSSRLWSAPRDRYCKGLTIDCNFPFWNPDLPSHFLFGIQFRGVRPVTSYLTIFFFNLTVACSCRLPKKALAAHPWYNCNTPVKDQEENCKICSRHRFILQLPPLRDTRINYCILPVFTSLTSGSPYPFCSTRGLRKQFSISLTGPAFPPPRGHSPAVCITLSNPCRPQRATRINNSIISVTKCLIRSGHIGRVPRRSSGSEEGRPRCRPGVEIAQGGEEETVYCLHSSDCTVVAQGEKRDEWI